MWKAILEIVANTMAIIRRRGDDKNAPDVKKAAVNQQNTEIQNEAEVAIQEKDVKSVQNLLG